MWKDLETVVGSPGLVNVYLCFNGVMKLKIDWVI